MTFPFMFTETPPGPSSTGISPPSSEKMALSSRHTAGKHSSIRRNRVDGAWFTFTIPECRLRLDEGTDGGVELVAWLSFIDTNETEGQGPVKTFFQNCPQKVGGG